MKVTATHKIENGKMGQFVGTIQEFHTFIGPMLRNAINGLTRNHRLPRNGVCQLCKKRAELHSAPLHGRDRRAIIEQVLHEHMNERGIVSCNLEEVKDKILEAHKPIDQNFQFLCQPCHKLIESLSKK